MDIKVSKCSIPIIWLDTSVIIKMALWKLGRPLNKTERERIPELYGLVYKLVREKKLICPFGDQGDEIWVGQDACKRVATDLSLGIKFRHRLGIQELQTQRVMKAFINKKNKVEFPYTDAFYRDPAEEIKKVGSFIITANTGRLEPIEKTKERIAAIHKEWEDIRIESQKHKENFEYRLNLEYQGHLRGILELARPFLDKIKQGIVPTVDDFMCVEYLGLPLAWWERYEGRPPGIEGVIGFYQSDTFKVIPTMEIACTLLAEILTQSTRIESGDSMDIQQLAAVSPYCQMLITDNKMKNRFKKLGLDNKYQVVIFALSDYEEIKTFLRNI
jgi:hypothetical protein